MPRPATLTDAIDLVRKSGLLEDDALKAFVARTRARGFHGLSTDDLLGRMAEEGLLTPFQARQLAEGRWRGLVLGNYHLKARIGKGGMGQVYLGEHCKLRRPVAIKVLNASLADDAVAKARLVREAQSTAALDHTNIVRVFDIDAEHSPPYMVMEYVDGVSLQALVAVTGTLCLEAAVLCGRQIASGLAHAASAGLVHRDIKPANLLLDRLGAVKILDLGIVLSREDSKLTLRTDGRAAILGTIDYLAPEQALDSHAVDRRADIYALGGTLYFLLAGQPPFGGGNPVSRLRLKQTTDPEPIHRLRPDVPEILSATISKMLARRPEDRYQSAAEVAEALAPWAVPVAGFPEEIFARLAPPSDLSGEILFQARSGLVRNSHRSLAGLQANGSNVHACLTTTLEGYPTADLPMSSAVTPPPQTQQTRPESSLPRRAKSKPAQARPRRGAAGSVRKRTPYLVIALAILALLAVAILCVRFLSPTLGARTENGSGIASDWEYPVQHGTTSSVS